METRSYAALTATTLAGAVAAAAILVACSDGGGVTAPDGPQGGGDPSPAVTGSVDAEVSVGSHVDGEQIVTVQIRGEEVTVGAYQGRLRFDASTLSLDRVVKGEGGDGTSEFHAVNDLRAEEGELRFGAYAVESFADPVALELVFRTPRAIQASDLEVTLEVVGTVEGKVMPRERTSVRELFR